MRSNSATRNPKPPPPIPPRPSKTLVAEALAKTRSAKLEDSTPNGFFPVSKSQSHSNVGINNKVASQIQRSTSNANEKKENSRPVVFQSDSTKKIKSNVLINIENDRNRVSRNNSFNEKNHVNSLIDEMFASILDIPDEVELPEALNQNVKFESSTSLKFNDKHNHEFLISELQNMHKRKNRPPPLNLNFIDDKIHQSDWVEVNNGQEVRLSRCEIIISDIDKGVDVTTDHIGSRLNMSSYGLPPLPKSLSGFSLNPQTPSGHSVYPHPRISNGAESPGITPTNLDNQLAILRREMYSLRQLDLSLLSQLWSLNESIQEFRQMLQDQDDRGLSPPSPSPSPSSCDDGETDEFFSPSPMKLRPAPPPPPLRRASNSSSANSSEYGTV